MKYGVEIPVTGIMYLEIEADSEEEAVEMALNSSDATIDNVVEWEPCLSIVTGNVFHGMLNEADVREID